MRAGRLCASLGSLALVGVFLYSLAYSGKWYTSNETTAVSPPTARGFPGGDVTEQTTHRPAKLPGVEPKTANTEDRSPDKGDSPQEVIKTPSGVSSQLQKNDEQNQAIPKKVGLPLEVEPRPVLIPNDTGQNAPLYFENEEHVARQLHKLVHLDLKGAPPKLSYFERIFPYFKKWGATGLLIEYEDMFPYVGYIKALAAPNAYSPEDIKTILKLAKDNDLKVIPLVQTFGHMEFVLEHNDFKHLREGKENPCCIIPLKSESLGLIQAMIKQVMDLHPAISHIHIGSDEVYTLGHSEESRRYMSTLNVGKDVLFFRHVKAVSAFIRNTYPEVKPIMWDDMMRHVSLSALQESSLGNLVEPMVWVYTPDIEKRISEDLWQKYATVFPRIWLASAFKGATGKSQFVTDISYHMKNHMKWLKIMGVISKMFTEVEGIALTGWQRYDHRAVLCELLPAGLPSLAVNLNMLVHGKFDQNGLKNTSKLLDCRDIVELTLNNVEHQPDCAFPGSAIYAAVLKLHHVKSMTYSKDLSKPVSNSTADITSRAKQYEALSNSYKNLVTIFQAELSQIYFEDMVKEFVETHVMAHKNNLDAIYQKSIKPK